VRRRDVKPITGKNTEPLEDYGFFGPLSHTEGLVLSTLITIVAPSTAEVAAPVYLKIPPENPRTFTPQEARHWDEILAPREDYAGSRALIEQRRAAGGQSEAELSVGPEVPESLELIGPTA
jgi:hypothetical protein